MKKLLSILLVTVMIAGCSPSTQIEKSWRDPNTTISNNSYSKVLCVALLRNEATRRIVEDDLVKKLNGKGIASYLYYQEKEVTESKAADLKTKLVGDGFDGAIVMRLINVDKETNYVPGTSVYPTYYGGFGGYYYNSWYNYSNPGYYTTDKIYNVETNVYSLKQDKLIWTGVTSTVNPTKADKMYNDIADVILSKMKSEGFLK
ncbi:hypothetical protein [Flavihumibacter petaseus]|uniref:DUF4136 domain-containing protein n=1 Tax=Flavihumibacter petaseus NBRC 106054 TaxID=1220578 RepID=A0A0E9MYK6_9BACT|nr:hypothetical protein [Flavihumibacter petaseus]GAO42210.1 hypothetical protein FPE01S_01_12230 [Flavihumibacter petaseus NBRC 106054]